MDIDQQDIEKRDFPIIRRGYDPAAVDAHLQALAAEIEDLKRAPRATTGGAEASLASTAGTQVQAIVQAAETAAAGIESEAAENARNVREDADRDAARTRQEADRDAARTRQEADRDAARTREEAIEQARAHVAAVARSTAVLLERVGSMDGEVNALTDSLRAGANRLADGLASVETNMGELYDAASGRSIPAAGRGPSPVEVAGPSPVAVGGEVADSTAGAPSSPPRWAQAAVPPSPAAEREAPPPEPSAPESALPLPPPVEPARGQASAGKPDAGPSTAGAGESDSARLVALNMALNGDSREDVDRYLAEHFQQVDRQKLIVEVYAAIDE